MRYEPECRMAEMNKDSVGSVQQSSLWRSSILDHQHSFPLASWRRLEVKTEGFSYRHFVAAVASFVRTAEQISAVHTLSASRGTRLRTSVPLARGAGRGDGNTEEGATRFCLRGPTAFNTVLFALAAVRFVRQRHKRPLLGTPESFCSASKGFSEELPIS